MDLAEREAVKLWSSFTLGASSNGIHPLKEDVTLCVGTFSTTIPAGTFTQNKKKQFEFARALCKNFVNMDLLR